MKKIDRLRKYINRFLHVFFSNWNCVRMVWNEIASTERAKFMIIIFNEKFNFDLFASIMRPLN